MAPSCAYGLPSWPRATSMRNAPMIAVITTIPAIAVAATSIWRKRSSRPSPRIPRIVSLRPPRRIAAANTSMTRNEKTALRGSPPIHIAANSSTPRATATAGWNHLDLVSCIEHLLHRNVEVARERKCQRERGGVLLGLDRVDRLPRHTHRRRELRLGQTSLEPPLPDVVSHVVSS